MRRRALLAALSALSCSDYPNQLVVSFDTDAPIAVSSGVDALEEPTALFDRIRIDVQRPGEPPCGGCSNDFAVTREMFERGQVSIGVPLPASGGWVLRARLYLARLAPGGDPPADATIDELVALPPASDNPGHAAAFLATDSVGVAHDPATTAPDALGVTSLTSAVGTWSAARRAGCDPSGAPKPGGSACIAGGAYWMGTQDGQPVLDRSAAWHRLGVISPFYLDTTEVTVGAFRTSGSVPASTNTPSDLLKAFCTFTSQAGPYEDLPVTCVTVPQATAYCQARGGDLPTAAQWEFVATRFGRAPYVWGFDRPECASATFSRCHTIGCFLNATAVTPQPCAPSSTSPLENAQAVHLGGPEAAQTCASAPCSFLDVLDVDGTQVVDLVGNVLEYTRDRPFAEQDTCFADHVLVDPSCPATTEVQTRGGSFYSDVFDALRADTTSLHEADLASVVIGFRCVYPATPLAK